MKVFKEGDTVKFAQDGLSAKGILCKKKRPSSPVWVVKVIAHTMKGVEERKPPEPHTCSGHFKKRIGWNVREDEMTITSETLDEILGLF